MRRVFRFSALLLLLSPFPLHVALAADKAPPDGRIKALAQKTIQRWKEAHVCCHREDIPDELSNAFRDNKVKAQNRPLTVAQVAPQVAGLPASRPLAVLFFRGHW